MGATTPIELGHGVQVYAVHAEDGWRAVGLSARGSMAGSTRQIRLSAPTELTARCFPSSDELAAATLRWLSTPQRTAPRR